MSATGGGTDPVVFFATLPMAPAHPHKSPERAARDDAPPVASWVTSLKSTGIVGALSAQTGHCNRDLESRSFSPNLYL
jgi:hypothetical protein